MSKAESAGLVLRLYELRREKQMRKARRWFASWLPLTAQDYVDELRGDNSPWLRMVTSYWDMAAALVLHGGIDAPMFHETTNEHIMVYAKLRPILAGVRALVRQPFLLVRLERLVAGSPDTAERLAYFEERFRAAREAAAQAAPAAGPAPRS